MEKEINFNRATKFFAWVQELGTKAGLNITAIGNQGESYYVKTLTTPPAPSKSELPRLSKDELAKIKLIEANDERVMVNGKALPVPFRIIWEEYFQRLILPKSEGQRHGEGNMNAYIRNKLSPFKNLIALLENGLVKGTIEVHPLILKEIDQCKKNIKYLQSLPQSDGQGYGDILEWIAKNKFNENGGWYRKMVNYDDLKYFIQNLKSKERVFTEREIESLQSSVYKITGKGKVMQLFNKLLGK